MGEVKRLDIAYLTGYNKDMEYVVQQTEIFVAWRESLRDKRARIAVLRRLQRMGAGNLGDVKTVGEGVSEARIDVGAGYRLYFTTRARTLIVLLCDGDKSTQDTDIKTAKTMAKEI
jgi:putative addiction module killer protein